MNVQDRADIEYAAERRLEAIELCLEAAADDRMAESVSESNPDYSEYLRRRAVHKRTLANNRDGGRIALED